METSARASSLRSRRLPPIPSSDQLLTQKMDHTLFADSKLHSHSMSKITAIRSPKGQAYELHNSSVLKSLKPDLGSLSEFISYDMGLKKPDELFKCKLHTLLINSDDSEAKLYITEGS